MSTASPVYVLARRTLLDVLDALHEHLDNLILVGAQAIYVHTGDRGLPVPPMTTDADIALNVIGLADYPEISARLKAAGFTPGLNPGHWVGTDSWFDLMVVPHQSGRESKTARAAKIPPHLKETARITRGLEAALVDHQLATLNAFEPADTRAFSLRIAGPAALITAKCTKIEDRFSQDPDRVLAKDALDMLRLLQQVPIDQLIKGFSTHRTEENAWLRTQTAMLFLAQQGNEPTSLLPQLATQAAAGDPQVPLSFAALVNELVGAFNDL